MRFHVQTGGSTLTAQQPDVNVVRTTVQALAAVLGGAQSLHTNALDEALGLPDALDRAARAPDATSVVSRVGCRGDRRPAGGSYYVETLTDEIDRAARWRRSRRSTSCGGTLAALGRRLPAGRDRRRGVRRAAGRRGGGADHRRRQRLHRRGRGAATRAAARSTRISRRRQVERTHAVRARRDAARRPTALARPRRPRHRAPRTSCPASAPASRPTSRSARSPTPCGASGASIAHERSDRSTTSRSSSRSIDEALPRYRELFGLEPEAPPMTFAPQRVRLCFLPTGPEPSARIELVEPIDDDSGVARFLAVARRGRPPRLLR